MAIRTGPTGQRFDLVAPTARDHSPKARELLRKAGLSMESELDHQQLATLQRFTDQHDVPGHRVRLALIPSLRGEDDQHAPIAGAALPTRTTNDQGEHIMAKTATKSKKSAPTKGQIIKVAQMRRGGATWDEVISETDIKTNSTGFRELLESAGFDKYGRKGGRGESKAKGWGSADMKGNSSKPKATKKVRKVKRTKATAKK